MTKDIIWVVITCTISFIVPGVLGYLVGTIKTYKKRESLQIDALRCLLRSNITGKYYVYKQLGYVPRYERENVNYMYSEYKEFKGNSYIDLIMEDFNKLPVKEVL